MRYCQGCIKANAREKSVAVRGRKRRKVVNTRPELYRIVEGQKGGGRKNGQSNSSGNRSGKRLGKEMLQILLVDGTSQRSLRCGKGLVSCNKGASLELFGKWGIHALKSSG